MTEIEKLQRDQKGKQATAKIAKINKNITTLKQQMTQIDSTPVTVTVPVAATTTPEATAVPTKAAQQDSTTVSPLPAKIQSVLFYNLVCFRWFCCLIIFLVF